MQCVVEMGSPKAEAIETVSAVEISAQYPLDGEIFAILMPITRIILQVFCDGG